ncbi:hypothetical protein G3565_32970 [Escherichia coli]|nr:hypothetical protein [Escherichia coli]
MMCFVGFLAGKVVMMMKVGGRVFVIVIGCLVGVVYLVFEWVCGGVEVGYFLYF